MKDYKYILFDLDGTIIDSKEGIFNCVRYTFEKMGWPLPPEEVMIKFIGPPLYKSFGAIGAGKTTLETMKAVEIYREIYNRKGAFECSLYDGIEELICALKANGKKVIVATAKSQRGAEAALKHHKIFELFDFVSGAPEDKSRNEKEEIIAYIVKELNIDPNEAVMIGDRYYDAVGAKLNNMDCIGVRYGYGTDEELLSNGAIALVDTTQELADILRVNI